MRSTFATLGFFLAIASQTVASPTPFGEGGICGPAAAGATCQDTTIGNCCSRYGYCGSTDAYCGAGCQSGFGTCNSSGAPAGMKVSEDATCGTGVTCIGSGFGDCCSSSGWCGSTTDYCEAGCQSAFGKCTGGSSSAAPMPMPMPSAAISASAAGTAAGTRTYNERSRATQAPACNYNSNTASMTEIDKPAAGSDGLYSAAVEQCKAKCDALPGCKVYFFQKSNPAFRSLNSGKCYVDTAAWQPNQLECNIGAYAFSIGYELASAPGSAPGSVAASAPSPTAVATPAARTYAERNRATQAPACNYNSNTASMTEIDKPAAGSDGLYSAAVEQCKAKCDALPGCKVYFFQKSNPAFRSLNSGKCYVDTAAWQPNQLECNIGAYAFSIGYELV